MSGIQKQQQSKQTQAKSNTPKAPEQATQNVNLEQLIEAPETMRPDQVLAAQKQVGNQVVQRALDGSKRRNAVTDQNGYLNDDISGTIQQKRGGGSPLPDSLRQDVSKRLKHDFDDVRIHTDEQAHELSRKINARAFTIGKDIFFKKGVFAPSSKQGRETIMHELTHVVQQSGASGASGRLKLGAPDTSHEKQADKVGKANSSVEPVKTGTGNAVQRQNNTGMPDQLKDGMENLAGLSMDPVKVHYNSPKPAQLQAHAYAQGSDIHLRPGQERHLPHEAGHVVQQKQGRVRPTTAAQGMPVNDDPGLEREADMMGAAAVQMQRMPEEEELQGQPDAGGLIQRMEEEELQGQPDVGGLVQRETEEEKKKERRKVIDRVGILGAKKQRQRYFSSGKTTDKMNNKEAEQHKKELHQVGRTMQEKQTMTAQFKEKAAQGDGLSGFGLKHVETNDRSAPNLEMSAKEKEKLTKGTSRGKLMDTLRDPSKSKEEIEEAQEKLKDLYGVKSKELQKANKERQGSLRNSAEKGDPEAYKKWKAEKKPSTMGKLGGLAKGFLGSAAKDLKTQLFGEEKKEEKKEAPAPASGGGSGVADLLEKKIAENQKLRGLLQENNIEIPAE